jgi:hypothetical protein
LSKIWIKVVIIIIINNIYETLLLIWCAPFGSLYFFFFQLFNGPELGAGIDRGMALKPFQSSFGPDSNPQPFNCESSKLTTRPEFVLI